MNKKLVILMGVGFVVCLVLTIVFRILMDNQNLEYEEVEVRVVSTDSESVRLRPGITALQRQNILLKCGMRVRNMIWRMCTVCPVIGREKRSKLICHTESYTQMWRE